MSVSLTTGSVVCRLRGLTVAATPEERVRQRVIDQLLAGGYPWHLWTCEVAHPRWGAVAGRADLLFHVAATRALAVIEVKVARPRPIDLEQAHTYGRQWGCQVAAVTDGVSWLVEQRIDGEWQTVGHFPVFAEWG
ncbi:MAG: type I restriction enzyme HsdR N-terminal domain-containing protein [bacterium]